MDIATVVAWVQAVIWIGAVAFYLWRQVLREGSMPNWMRSNRLLGIVVITGAVASIAFLYLNYHRPIRPIQFSADYHFTETRDRKFLNEEVSLDGHRYLDCSFRNVTFVWNGTAPFQMINTTTEGFWIRTDSGPVLGTVLLLKATHMLKEDVPVTVGPEMTPLEIK